MESIRDSQSGKTYRELFQAIRGETSSVSSRRSRPSPSPDFQYLNLKQTEQGACSGLLQEPSWETVSASLGESTMLNTGVCPSVVQESTLSQILQANVPPKYSLSATACLGILRRALKRGKKLPPMLWDALIEALELNA